MRNRDILLKITLLILITLLQSNFAEKVSKISYSGQPENLNGKTIIVPNGTVALSEKLNMKIPSSLMPDEITGSSSIFFIIDNSGSMWMDSYTKNDGTKGTAMDINANRYKVTSRLIDSIYNSNPDAEVGLGVFNDEPWFQISDDQIFEAAINSANYGYIPLLKLNKEYKSDKAGTATGKEILQYFLKTKPKTGDSNPLDYIASKATSGGTNITTGFDQAKSALSKSLAPKNSQFIIFISDGDATKPTIEAERIRFQEGKDVPTTFTVFFSDDGNTPQSIITMTTNIKNNGYSSNNSKSRAWPYKNNNEDDLLDFLMKNVISLINQNTDADIIDVDLNNTKNTSTWDGTSVAFKEMFPLTGATTDFALNINYYIEDTITVDSKLEIKKTDTTINTNFDITITKNAILADTITAEFWERSLGFYSGANRLSVITSSTDADINFIEDAIDIYYGYVDIDIHLKSVIKGDEETIRLNQNGNSFSKKLLTSFEDNKKFNDGTVQVDKIDTIVATFRNPKLPLDTIEIRIPYEAGNLLSLKNSSYYDNNGDGFIDSIYVWLGVDTALTDDDANIIFSEMTIAPDRNFDIVSNKWENGGFAIKVKENSLIANTSILTGDTISLNGLKLATGSIVYESKIDIIDSIAPVINFDASLFDLPGTDNDTISVVFSEEINEESNSSKYFEFRENSNSYTVFLTPIEYIGNTVKYKVNSVSGASLIKDGDTLRIDVSTALISDKNGNIQKNSSNIEKRVLVVKTITIGDVTYFDINADGLIDSIVCTINGELNDDIDPNYLVSRIELPSFRNITVDSATFSNSKLSMLVTEKQEIPNTAITENDIVTLKAGATGSINVLSDLSTTPIDSLSPVIIPKGAYLLDSLTGTDYVEITFSEDVTVSDASGRPFQFKDDSGIYDILLGKYQGEKNKWIFKVQVSHRPEDGENDSIWINNGASVLIKDLTGRTQKNPNNIKRELLTKTLIAPYKIIVNAVTPYTKELTEVPDELKEPQFNLSTLDNGKYTGMIITAQAISNETHEPIKGVTLKGYLIILDPLGNVILEQKDMVMNDKYNSLIFVWNGLNMNDRPVGSGLFLAKFMVSVITPNGSIDRTFKQKRMVGVKVNMNGIVDSTK